MEITVYECEICKSLFSKASNLQIFCYTVNNKSLTMYICEKCSKCLDDSLNKIILDINKDSIIIY